MPFKEVPALYLVWRSMRDRCLNPNYRQWDDYGGRGIKICPEWDSFTQFASDMGPRPSPQHSLDRKDNDGHYEPSNCRWATRREQQLNQRRAVYVTIAGERYRAIELAELSGHKTDTIVTRAARGMSYAEVIASERYVDVSGLPKATAARVAKQRNATHCKHGHPWTPENTRITPEGWKNCRACHNAKMRRRASAAA